MKITHLAFDMDGVIYSAEGFIAEAYERAILYSNLNLPMPSTEQIMQQIGKPIREIFTGIFPNITDEEMDRLRTGTRKFVVEMISEKKGRVYEGIPDLLKLLSQKYTLAACSNGGPRYVTTILETYGLQKYFLPVMTLEGEGVSSKNELLKSYISKYNSNPASWIMIGDRKSDLDAAVYNKCKFIGCTWGHANDGELNGADFFADEPKQILEVLKKLES